MLRAAGDTPASQAALGPSGGGRKEHGKPLPSRVLRTGGLAIPLAALGFVALLPFFAAPAIGQGRASRRCRSSTKAPRGSCIAISPTVPPISAIGFRAIRWRSGPAGCGRICSPRSAGRPDQGAVPGEILLAPIRAADGSTRAAIFVETSTGYLALLDQVGRNNQLGTISVAIGRPFEPIASMDGNYALLMRRDSAGRTEGAYLYHATSGRGFYYGGLRKLETDVTAAAVADLPQLSGRVAAAPIQSSREQTRSYLLADGGNGELYFADLSGNAARFAIRKSALNLSTVFAQPGSHQSPQRFVAVPILANDDHTQHVLIVDVTSGAMALVESVDQRPTLRLLRGRRSDRGS